MRYDPPLIAGSLIRRYKRFLVDVQLDSGETVVAHCANPGSMKTCLEAGARVWLSHHPDSKRKLPYTWQLIELGRTRINVNPVLANALVDEALRRGVIGELRGYTAISREVRFGAHSRLDFLLEQSGRPKCYVEVKSATMTLGSGRAAFPDSVTERGRKHLVDLRKIVQRGQRAALVFCVSRSDAKSVEPARDIDPEYARELQRAVAGGVEVLGYKCRLGPTRIALASKLPVVLDADVIA